MSVIEGLNEIIDSQKAEYNIPLYKMLIEKPCYDKNGLFSNMIKVHNLSDENTLLIIKMLIGAINESYPQACCENRDAEYYTRFLSNGVVSTKTESDYFKPAEEITSFINGHIYDLIHAYKHFITSDGIEYKVRKLIINLYKNGYADINEDLTTISNVIASLILVRRYHNTLDVLSGITINETNYQQILEIIKQAMEALYKYNYNDLCLIKDLGFLQKTLTFFATRLASNEAKNDLLEYYEEQLISVVPPINNQYCDITLVKASN